MGVTVDVDVRGRKNVLVDPWAVRSELAQALHEHPDADVVVAQSSGHTVANVDVLHGQPIRALDLSLYRPLDLSPLLTLSPSLESLTLRVEVDTARPELDVPGFAQLVHLSAPHPLVARSLGNLRLRLLFLSDFGGSMLTSLAALNDTLDVLSLRGAEPLVDLTGLSDGHLSAVAVERAPVLSTPWASSFDPTNQICECRGLVSIASIAEYAELQELTIGAGAPLHSVRALAELRALTSIAIWETPLVDTDLSPLLRLPNLHHVRVGSGRRYVSSIADI